MPDETGGLESPYMDLDGLSIDNTSNDPEPASQPPSPTEHGDSPDSDHHHQTCLTERDLVLAQAIGHGQTHAQAAALAGLSTKTIQRRLADPAFAAEVQRQRRHHYDQIAGTLAQAATQATQTLVEVMGAENPLAHRLRAAEAILGHNTRYHRQVVDHDRDLRIEQLEAILLTEAQPSGNQTSPRGQR
jgi:hypothetical protein